MNETNSTVHEVACYFSCPKCGRKLLADGVSAVWCESYGEKLDVDSVEGCGYYIMTG